MNLESLIAQPRADHLVIAEYLTVIISLIVIPYLAIQFGSLLFAFTLNLRGKANNIPSDIKASQDITRLFNGSWAQIILLGVLPLLVLGVAYAQILYGTEMNALKFFINTTIFTFLGLFFAYLAYRAAADIEANEKSYRIASGLAQTFLFLGVWGYIGTTSLVLLPEKWPYVHTVIPFLFSATVFVRLLFFIFFAGALTSVAILFFSFVWSGGRSDLDSDLADFYRRFFGGNALGLTMALPMFVVWDLYILPRIAKTAAVFNASIAFILILLLVALFLYYLLKNKNLKLSGYAFPLFIVATLFLLLSQYYAQATAIQEQLKFLYTKAQEAEEQLKMEREMAKGEAGPSIAVGQEIFQKKCIACHQFDKRLVGPPYMEVLEKYVDNPDALVDFVMNPRRINTDYPPMPAQGLTKVQAESVAKYLLEEYKKRSQGNQ